METRKDKKHLPVNLTMDEKLAAADEVGRETLKYQEAEDRKKEVTAQLTADVQSHRTKIQRLGALLAAGYEYRPVEVEITIDHKLDKVMVVRTDTGEMVETRARKPEEMQSEMPLA